jgi:hypothetical protein
VMSSRGTGKERVGNRKGTEREQKGRERGAREGGCPRRRAMVWMHWTAKQEGQSSRSPELGCLGAGGGSVAAPMEAMAMEAQRDHA